MTKIVVIPWAWAWAMMAFGSPPLDLFTYQIHIPLPSNALPLGGGVLGGGVLDTPPVLGFMTRMGPTAFVRRPRGSFR